jgi:RNA recognition motif-containing protein
MASTVEKVAEKVTQVAEQAVNDVTNALSNTSLTDNTNKDENKDAVHASAAEGRRLYIGNLAYATTEGELKEFFKGYLV